MFAEENPMMSAAETQAQIQMLRERANGVIRTSLYIAAALWSVPFAFDLIKGRF